MGGPGVLGITCRQTWLAQCHGGLGGGLRWRPRLPRRRCCRRAGRCHPRPGLPR